jgi:hypothetical protein
VKHLQKQQKTKRAKQTRSNEPWLCDMQQETRGTQRKMGQRDEAARSKQRDACCGDAQRRTAREILPRRAARDA